MRIEDRAVPFVHPRHQVHHRGTLEPLTRQLRSALFPSCVVQAKPARAVATAVRSAARQLVESRMTGAAVHASDRARRLGGRALPCAYFVAVIPSPV